MPKASAARAARIAKRELSDFGGLEDLLGFRLRMAQTVMRRDFMASVAALDLTQKQTAALWLVGSNPGISQAAIADALLIDRATMMAIIDRLEAAGRVLRKRCLSDGRRQELHLTPAGQRALAKAKAAIARHERRFTSGLTEEELAILRRALAKLAT